MSDLHTLTARVLNESASTDPRVLSKEVYNQLNPDDYAAIVWELLPQFVTSVMGERRREALSGLPGSRAPKKGKHKGRRRMESGFRQWMDERVYVPGSGYKRIAEATYDDLQALSKDRGQRADEMNHWARQYRTLAALLTDHDASTVQDLPAEVLAQIAP